MEKLQDYTLTELNMQSIIHLRSFKTHPSEAKGALMSDEDFAQLNTNCAFSMRKGVKTQLIKSPTYKQEQQQQQQKQKQQKEKIKRDAIKPISFFEPREVDSLFWIAFVILHGDDEYNNTTHRNVILEKKHKIEFVEKIRNNKSIVKTNGFSTLAHLEEILAYGTKIDIPTFFTLCAIENKNVLYINKRTFFELKSNDTTEVHVIHALENKKYAYELSNSSVIDLKKASLYQLEAIDKPIRNISYYKVQDLIDICLKLEIETKKDNDKTKTKNELYESIVQKIEL